MEQIPLDAVQWSALVKSQVVTVNQVWAFGHEPGTAILFRSGQKSATVTVARIEYGHRNLKSKIFIENLTIQD